MPDEERRHSSRRLQVALNILIVGAGLAGLALARALELRGLSFDIVERACEPSPLGAGIYLPGNATRALSDLGLLEAVSAVGHPIHRQRIFGASGRLLHDMDVEAFWDGVGPCLALSRHALHGELLKSIETPIYYGTPFALTDRSAGKCYATVRGVSKQYDLVIGADGLHSGVRRALFTKDDPHELGQSCWRFVTDNNIALKEWTVTLGRSRALLAVPLENDRLYVYADMDMRVCAPTRATPMDTLTQLFGNLGGPVAPFLSSIGANVPIHEAPLAMIPARTWNAAGTALIGDAAHATSPSMAQGAAMAFEDAVLLARCLQRYSDVSSALEDFWHQRLPRIRWVQNQSRARDRLRRAPGFLRDFLLKAAATPLYRRSHTRLLEPIASVTRNGIQIAS
jgi:2-polyprenyl-6-methoxyphenol hydroxylase-like FAD-dependent oxidoreductase